MYGVAVRMKAIFACEIPCDRRPRVRRVTRALWQVFQDFRPPLPCVTTAGDAATTAFAAARLRLLLGGGGLMFRSSPLPSTLRVPPWRAVRG
eukprot:2037178-Pleurochrysis_carterae.AAC.1